MSDFDCWTYPAVSVIHLESSGICSPGVMATPRPSRWCDCRSHLVVDWLDVGIPVGAEPRLEHSDPPTAQGNVRVECLGVATNQRTRLPA